MGYLTPSSIPGGTQCRSLFIPDDPEFIANVTGALQSLLDPNNWTQESGGISPDDAAAALVDMFDNFCFQVGPCKMIGEYVWFAGGTSPNENWLACDGAYYEIDDYPDLYAVIGTTYGSSGSTFAVPDMRFVALVGIGTHSDTEHTIALGETVGEFEHTLTSGEMPSHNHTDSGHAHSTGNSLPGLALAPGEEPVLVPNPIPASTGYASAAISSSGGGSAHNNIQPIMGGLCLIVAKNG